ncbi:pseudouridine-5'-phosphate glycosidase [Acidisoma cellulosilytica]|uniref:Pseudouridine-5'-phosphate glycosidase n=1 Tax=Acidisoma cellulosilyticum TaxID=2802395 RepID=A0A963Z5T5_9PROT|nr:pseudouridine-5'-phosphate glycosidase [Acidisoma cellulosilyticum]MCB8883435.1 pseudouridine-5'-phosphate glycosidase [Acidisoma cellulosilyticum]
MNGSSPSLADQPTTLSPPITLSRDVAEALQSHRPVVALESTIITHGMPFPQNLEMARQVEADCRAGNAEPATIALLDGEILVGMSAEQLERLANAPAPMKLSRADLGFALAMGRSGGTTVSATMICAALAGIEVFATGGIGGVHRDGQDSLDISADLDELARTAVTVVCAGAKAILDLPRTLEYLETRGVPVLGYQTDHLPAFWSRESPWRLPMRADTPAQIAAVMLARQRLGLGGGVLVTNPIPADDEIPYETMAILVEEALQDAKRQRVEGKAVTPFLLSRLLTLSEGQSLTANIALVRNNVRLGAAIACALAEKKGSTP